MSSVLNKILNKFYTKYKIKNIYSKFVTSVNKTLLYIRENISLKRVLTMHMLK